MNSTKNSGRGLLVPPKNDVKIRGPWMPLTPEKPILARSNGIPVERHGNHHQLGKANWHELVGLAGRNLRQKMNYYGAGQNFNLAGLMGENGSSYTLNVPHAEKGGFSHQNGISYDLGSYLVSSFCLLGLCRIVLVMIVVVSDVALVLWIISYIGSFFNFLTLVYIGVLLSLSVPVLYKKYQDQIDENLIVAHKIIQTQFRKIDDNILRRLPLLFNKENKTQ
ncbi:unnamed protein product [Camellia sinensis]